MRKVIVNTTPIIALADIGYLNLLKELYGEILIPEAVLSEIISEPAHTLVKQSDWIKVKKAPVQSQKNSFSTRLHAGEIEVITLAQECSADLLILDDNMAKKTAIKQVLKYAPMATEFTRAVAADETIKTNITPDMMEEPDNLTIGIVARTREECMLIQKTIEGWQPPVSPKYKVYLKEEQ